MADPVNGVDTALNLFLRLIIIMILRRLLAHLYYIMLLSFFLLLLLLLLWNKYYVHSIPVAWLYTWSFSQTRQQHTLCLWLVVTCSHIMWVRLNEITYRLWHHLNRKFSLLSIPLAEIVTSYAYLQMRQMDGGHETCRRPIVCSV